MTKDEILAEIASYNDLIADASVPQDEKDFAKEEIADLKKQLEKATGAPAGKIHIVKPAANEKTKAEPKKTNKLTELTSKEDRSWEKHFAFYLEEGETDSEADKHAWEAMQEEFPRLKNFDGVKPEKSGAKKSDKPKKSHRATVVHKFKGKNVKKELNEEDCAELLKAVSERRRKAAKSEKKSKSKPVMEKVAANVATAVKQAVKNVSAADIKDDPKGEINKFERIAKAAKTFLAEMRSILGEDYDKDSIEGEFKEIHDLIKDIKKKYNK